MCGRADGLGARSSSIVLLIVLAHRPNHALDERDLILGDAVLLVERGIGPAPIPWLYGNPPVHAAENVLGGLAKRHEEPRKPRSQIRRDTLCLDLRSQRSRHEVGLGADGARFTNYW